MAINTKIEISFKDGTKLKLSSHFLKSDSKEWYLEYCTKHKKTPKAVKSVEWLKEDHDSRMSRLGYRSFP